MNAVTYTPEQAKAISERRVSVALSAGAGCGKTFVLTERFLSYLEPGSSEAPDPAELGELVAITFTERAAREMRDRIRQKCYERLQNAQGEKAAYWLSLLRALDAARVSTIHSFCGSLLRSHAVEAQLRTASILYTEQNDRESAVRHLRDFGEANPRFATDMLVAQAQLLQQMNQPEEARRILDEALASAPDDPALHSAHAQLYLVQSQIMVARGALDPDGTVRLLELPEGVLPGSVIA